jgi:hypothetical protein
MLNDFFCVRSMRRYHHRADLSLDLVNSKYQFRRNALYALVGSVSSINTTTISPVSFYCSEKHGWNRRRHDWNWAVQYSPEMSRSRSLQLSVTKPHHAYVSLSRQPCNQEKTPKINHIAHPSLDKDARAVCSIKSPHPPSSTVRRRLTKASI